MYAQISEVEKELPNFQRGQAMEGSKYWVLQESLYEWLGQSCIHRQKTIFFRIYHEITLVLRFGRGRYRDQEADVFQDIYLLQNTHSNERCNLGFTVYMCSGAFCLWYLKVG